MDAGKSMIRHLIVLGHPGPEGFAHTVAATCGDTIRGCGQEPLLRDLYALDFDPRLRAEERSSAGVTPAEDVRAELEYLRRADSIILVYPIWFGMPPAIIKGYVDRVMGAGFAAGNLMSGAHPLLAGKRLTLVTSSASTKPWLEEQGQWLGLRQTFDVYLKTIFGLASVDHVHFDAIVEATSAQYVDECQQQVRDALRGLCSSLLAERRHSRFEPLDHGAAI
jgi:NAD(P)H dehydrogenase (quinone)